MSYEGYTRTFHDYDGKTRIVRKDAVNPQDIKDWIKGTSKQQAIANSECPKCGRNTTGCISHTCP